ncbi:MAG TPA: hypothetical protein PLV61_13045 [Parvularculaceae bacterium]|nr:hypothetical protein [Parvularculaceae bacterium]
MNRTLLTFLPAALLLGACSTFGGAKKEVAPTYAGPAVEGVVLRPIADSALPKGTCGMVLWTLDEERPAPIFRYVAGQQGEVAIDGAPVALTRVEVEGDGAFGIFEEQTFITEDGLKLNVKVKFSLGFDGGTYLERGLVSVETPSGWRTVLPAAGLAGCRSK